MNGRSPADADLVRSAAGALRRIAREEPRGPWRWARPDLEVGEPPLTDAPLRTRQRLLDDPLHELTPPVAMPQPAGAPAGLVRPEAADALATLLERIAHRLDEDGADEIGRSAVVLARTLLHPAGG
jgi:hypothetical protein